MNKSNDLSSTPLLDIAKTSIIPLYARAVDAELPNSILFDKAAHRIYGRVQELFGTCQVSQSLRVGCCLRSKIIDEWCKNLVQVSGITHVVELGVGFNSRHERLNKLDLKWVEIDDALLIQKRHELFGVFPDVSRKSCSIFDIEQWASSLSYIEPSRILLIAEGVFCYCDHSLVTNLVFDLSRRFPGCWLAFDSMAPPLAWVNNKRKSTDQRERPDYQWSYWKLNRAFGKDVVSNVNIEIGFSEYGKNYYQQFPALQRWFFSLPVARRLYRMSLVSLGV